jgi:hypothetical protein
MHRASVAKTATLNSASIMVPSIESRLPFEGSICHGPEIFPVVGGASDDHHSLVLLIDCPRAYRTYLTGLDIDSIIIPAS